VKFGGDRSHAGEWVFMQCIPADLPKGCCVLSAKLNGSISMASRGHLVTAKLSSGGMRSAPGGIGVTFAMAAVVIIEDDARVRTALARALEGLGHSVAQAETAMAGLGLVMSEKPEVIVLDLGLPDVDGVELLKMLRPVSDAVVIAATARVAEEEIVRTLDAGADDYVCKPFSPEQLDARIRAALRRFKTISDDQGLISIGDLHMNPRTRIATLGAQTLELSRKEFDVLHFLASNEGTVVSKRELLAEVWRQPFFTTDKTVDVHISWLRRKLGESAELPRYLHSVRGVGVKLIAPTTPVVMRPMPDASEASTAPIPAPE
jgi:two-component system, OmpR family, KDP operon response regulator KdpE